MGRANPPSGAEVRKLVIDDHEVLRPMLDEVERLANRFEQGDESVGRTLRQHGFDFYKRFSGHLELEEEHLARRLRTQGERGQRLADRLEHEHREQRELLNYLLGRLGDSTTPTLLVARELRNFVSYVRLDMEHEERDLLTEDVLRD
jgi:hemerythrin-like domain-containing protein